MDSTLYTLSKDKDLTPESKISEDKKLSPLSKFEKKDHPSKYLFGSCHHHSLSLVRLTCEGNLNEPNFPRKLKKLVSKLKFLVSNDKKPFKVTKVEPWNSVRVTFNLPQDAAQRLRQLAEHGDENLRGLGILSVQIEGQQVISLRLSNQNNTNNTNNENIEQVNSLTNDNHNRVVSPNKDYSIKELNQNNINHDVNKYLFEQFNGGVGDESSDNSNNSSETSLPTAESASQPKTNSFYSEHQPANVSVHNSVPVSSLPPPAPPLYVTSTQQPVYNSQKSSSNSNSLLVQNNQMNNHLNIKSQTNSNFISSTNTSVPGHVSTNDSSVLSKENESHSGLVQSVNPAAPAMVSPQIRVQQKPFSSTDTNMISIDIQNQLPAKPPCVDSNSNSIRNLNPNQFNGPRAILISSSQPQQVFISSQKTVPIVSNLQSQSTKPPDSLSLAATSQSSSVTSDLALNSVHKSFDHNANYVNSSTQNSIPTYRTVPANASIQDVISSDSVSKKNSELPITTESNVLISQTNNTSGSDILGSSIDAVDDEDLLASVAATGANSLDLNSFTDLNDLNLLSMLEEMESNSQNPTNQVSVSSSLETVTSSNSSNDSSQVTENSSVATPPSAVNKNEEFVSPNVIAPQSTQPLPFFIAQQQHQTSAKLATTVVSGSQQILINSSTGAVLTQSQAHQLTQQLMASTSTGGSTLPVSSTLYPFTSMQHASIFTAKQQPLPQSMVASSPRHVFLPVRQIPTARTVASQQHGQQTVSVTRALGPIVTAASEMLMQNSQQQSLYRPVTSQMVRQALPATSNSSHIQSKPQIVIRQTVPYSASQSSNSSTGQQNTVALSSPLLVNLLQSDVQTSTSLQQTMQQSQQQPQQQFVSQAGTKQIRLISPSGTHGDGTQVMMMVRVTSAPQGTTQLINSANGSFVATVPSTQVVSSLASQVMEQNSNTSQSSDSGLSSTPNSKAKKPRKPRKTKNQVEVKVDNTIKTGILTSIQQTSTPISSGAITSIPLSLTNSRIQTSSVSTIFTFPTSSVAQTFKLHAASSKPQQTMLSGQTAGQHLFNQKRVQPVVMIANSNLINSVGATSESNLVSTPNVSSTNAFIITNVASTSLSSNTCSTVTSTTTTAGVQLSANRKQIFLATKSNSFPVSSALSAGAIVTRFANNSVSSSSSLVSSPMKFVSQSSSCSAHVTIASNSSSLTSSSECKNPINPTNTLKASKSSLTNIASPSVPLSISANTNSSQTINVSVSTSVNAVPSLELKSLSSPTVHNTLITSLAATNLPIAVKTSKHLSSQEFSLNQSSLVSSVSSNQTVTQSSTSHQVTMPIKTFPVQFQPNTATSATNSLLLNKLNQSTSSILASTPKLLPSTLHNFSNKSTLKTISIPVSQLPTSIQKQMLTVKRNESIGEEYNEKPISNANVGDSSYLINKSETLSNVIQSDVKVVKCEHLESLLSSNPTESKSTDNTKSITESSFKLTLADMLTNDNSVPSKLDSVFLPNEETDRNVETSAPISPSYFLAPPSAFEKNTENIQTENKSDDKSNENQSNKNDIDTGVLALKTDKQSVSTPCSSSSIDSSSIDTKTDILASTSSDLSTHTNTSTEAALVSSSSTITSAKASEDVQTKSNCYDSFSFYLSKHTYSQDLPDHILDDDEDGEDSDIDDFGLYSKTSHFLSGSIGSVGGNNNNNKASSSMALNDDTTVPTSKVNETLTTASSLDTSTKASFNIDLNINKSDIQTASAVKVEQTNQVIVNESKNETYPERHVVENSISQQNLIKSESSSKSSESLISKETISKLDNKQEVTVTKHSLMNGDLGPNYLNINLLENKPKCPITTDSKFLTTSVDVNSALVSQSKSNINESVLASKSYSATNALFASENTKNVTAMCKSQESFHSNESKTLMSSDVKNFKTFENDIQSQEIKQNVTVNQTTSKQRKPSISSATKVSSSTLQKSRRKTTTSISTMSQTMAVSESLFQTQNTANKSELQSLLASSPLTSSNSKSSTNIITTIASATSQEPSGPVSISDVSLPNPPSITEASSSGRPLFIAFKQQPQHSQNTLSSQQSNVSLQKDSSSGGPPSIQTSNAKLLKVLFPGVNIAGSSGNKLLAISNAAGNNSGQTLSQGIATSIAQSNFESTSQPNQTVTPVLGRYIVAGPGGQSFSQFVVVKSVMMNESNNVSSPSSISTSQLKFITASPNKLPNVSGAGTSQPLFIPMVTGSTGQTILSVKQGTPAESNENPATALTNQSIISNQIGETQLHSTNDNDTNKQACIKQPLVSPQITPVEVSSQPITNVQHLNQKIDSEYKSNLTPNTDKVEHLENTDVVDITKERTSSQEDIKDPLSDNSTPSSEQTSTVQPVVPEPFVITLDETSSRENPTIDNTVPAQIFDSTSQSTNETNIDESESSCNQNEPTSFQSLSQTAALEETTQLNPTVEISSSKKLLSSNPEQSFSDVSIINPSKMSMFTTRSNETTNQVLMIKDDHENKSLAQTPPRTVHIMIPSNDSISSSSSSSSNVVILKSDNSDKEQNIVQLNVNSGNSSPSAVRRQVLIAKPISQVQQSQQDIQGPPAIFATKSSGASITATKTLPTILRQSKRKSESFYHLQNAQQIPITNDSQQIKSSQHNIESGNQIIDNYSDTIDHEMANSGQSSSLKAKPFRQQSASLNDQSVPVLASNEEDNAVELLDVTQLSNAVPRPRKRARKSKVTTIHQPSSIGDLSTSLLLNYNEIPVEINDKLEAGDSETKQSETPSSSRVLRNSSTTSSPPKATVVTSKRGQRNNRSMLAQSASISIISSSSNLSDTISVSNSLDPTNAASKMNDKAKKGREVNPNIAARLTRSNRNRNKITEKSSLISNTNPEIILTDNAIDESIQLDSHSELNNNLDVSVANENSHTPISSSGQVSQPSLIPSMNIISVASTEPRNISLLESSNSNSSTASSSSSNSLLIKRPRKTLSSSSSTATKPSLRSNSASETLASPMTPTKRRRLAKEVSK